MHITGSLYVHILIRRDYFGGACTIFARKFERFFFFCLRPPPSRSTLTEKSVVAHARLPNFRACEKQLEINAKLRCERFFGGRGGWFWRWRWLCFVGRWAGRIGRLCLRWSRRFFRVHKRDCMRTHYMNRPPTCEIVQPATTPPSRCGLERSTMCLSWDAHKHTGAHQTHTLPVGDVT